ncbi:MAG: peptide chain release factor N(5)-glutamine methyltransferase [Opitutae bacterium]|nr:peptide chain release factor N(5)-glutamine methyltransferase [Opitutae bacterium]
MLTVLEIIKRTTDFLERRAVESARLNAELLIGHALGLRRMQLYLQFERPLTEAELETIRPLVKRRGLREPLQYIVGSVEFCGLRLTVDRRALIPRPETELLVEMVKQRVAPAPARVLDLGTGSGAIALALAGAYAEAAVTAADLSEPALELARENAAALGLSARVRVLASDWFSALPATEAFDLIVSNPPYLSDEETDAALPEVKDHEPRNALSAGADSGAALERIIRESRARLAAGGLLALETGLAQHGRLLAAATAAGFARAESHRDLTGRERFVLAFA